MPSRTPEIEVYKFNGASLADGHAVSRAMAIMTAPRETRLVAVVSALAGVTDQLLALAEVARTGNERAVAAQLEAVPQLHRAVAIGIVKAGPVRRELLAGFARDFSELRALPHGVASLRELTPRSRDFLVARGERLSARLVVAGLSARGVRASYVDAAALIPTDGNFGRAVPDLPASDRAVRRVLLPMLRRDMLPVVPGFVGVAPDGAVVTRGRGGSDLTDTVIGRALRALRITLWKDEPGLMTTDPRIVPTARILPQLNVRDAAELAYYGARVLQPRALIPIAHPIAHPLASLRGTDNQIVFTTRRYREHPLVITGPGPGAGPTVTAAGVLNDILQLAPR